jgi:hypothetical protein
MEDLAARRGIDQDQIGVLSITPKQWPDSSLGCPQKGVMYLQVITPGFLIELAVGGETYPYHTDTEGRVVLCKR